MGGHNNFLPNQPWSPAGGWFFIPKNAKSNLAILSLATFAISYVGYKFSEATQVQSNTEVDDATIARWNAAAKKSREASAIAKAAGSA
ncbi:uncharacterized protein SAPINGB_P004572 [Magnusiomyces paraingens]|uniref:Uncharacterized protein n=1 Tax=Magnusiomyces paraingens TaxID=2606893 RepID=A0A5E8BXN6_9ASCO|nr:uncharacterized protein SAPINGB_P004572 [Saprochaete ingens]VVT55389.1 unnamed protein product [Saprochaete ingens]